MSEIRFIDTEVKMPALALPVRTTVVTIGANKILLSPGSQMSDDQYKTLTHITDIVAPSHYHASGVEKALAKFPNARVWATPGLRRQRKNIAWTHDLVVDQWPYQSELPMVEVAGMPSVCEVVFVHRATQTLIVADLFFNLKNVSGFGSWMILNLFGSYKKFAISKLFMKGIKDSDAFRKSMATLMKIEFEKIAPGHGNVVEKDAKTLIMTALRERNLSPD